MAQERLAGPLVELLVDLVYHGLVIGEPRFAALAGGTWDELDLSAFQGRVTLGNAELGLFLDATGEAFHVLHEAMETRNKSASLVLSDGSEITAQLAHMRELGFGEEAQVELFHWTWGDLGACAYWVGRLHGYIPPGGNLSVREKTAERTRMRHDGYCLRGRYTWYILRHPAAEGHLVVLDTGGLAINREELTRDFLCLQFTLGGPLRLDRLAGIDRQRRVTAAIGLGHYLRTAGKHRVPVHDDIGAAQIWVPEFFTRLTDKIHQEGIEPLIIAISSYLDAVADHLDGGYLKAQVGLEAFAKRLVVSPGERDLLVKDEGAWKEWISSLRKDIGGHLKNPKKLDTIYGKFVASMFAPTGELVQKAFGERAVLPAELLDEIRKRNYPTHGFLMNAGIEHDIDRDFRRLEMVQTLIVALVAMHIGYDGPLKGYEVRDDGGRHPPSWWPSKGLESDAADQFLAERQGA
jgi:hypothetical protein